MVRKRYHGELLQELIPRSVYVHGDISSTIRKELYSRLHKKEISCIISTVGKVGLDIPNLNAVINAEGLAAETITLQKMRSLTASSDKDYGIIIDFMDHGVYLRDHSELRLAMYKKIDGFIIKEYKVSPTLFDEVPDGQDGQG
jgi:superfamily II DNA or RNA helicase